MPWITFLLMSRVGPTRTLSEEIFSYEQKHKKQLGPKNVPMRRMYNIVNGVGFHGGHVIRSGTSASTPSRLVRPPPAIPVLR